VAARRTMMLSTGKLIAVPMLGQTSIMIRRAPAVGTARGCRSMGTSPGVIWRKHWRGRHNRVRSSFACVCSPGPVCCWQTDPGGTARRGLADRRDPIRRRTPIRSRGSWEAIRG